MSDLSFASHVLFQAVYVFCVCYAIVSDFSTLKIPNWIPVTLVAAFALFAVVYLDASTILRHLYIAAIVFALGVGFFVAGWIGGGDVKLLTAVTLWIGQQHAPAFVLLMALLGAALAGGLYTVNRYADELEPYAARSWLMRRLLQMATSGRCPYGVAIGIAGLARAVGIW
jgi:prepilin peptidase CpaA